MPAVRAVLERTAGVGLHSEADGEAYVRSEIEGGAVLQDRPAEAYAREQRACKRRTASKDHVAVHSRVTVPFLRSIGCSGASLHTFWARGVEEDESSCAYLLSDWTAAAFVIPRQLRVGIGIRRLTKHKGEIDSQHIESAMVTCEILQWWSLHVASSMPSSYRSVAHGSQSIGVGISMYPLSVCNVFPASLS